MASDGTYLYAMGGMQMGGFPQMFAQLRQYDPVSNTWMTLASMPLTVFDTAAAVSDNQLYCFGGSDPSRAPRRDPAVPIASGTDDAVATLTRLASRLPSSAAGRRHGGYGRSGMVAATDEFNPRAATSSPADMPAAAAPRDVGGLAPPVVATGHDNSPAPWDTMYAYTGPRTAGTRWWPFPRCRGTAPRPSRSRPRKGDRRPSDNDEPRPGNTTPRTTRARRADMLTARFFHGAAASAARAAHGGAGVTSGDSTPRRPAPAPSNKAPVANAGGNRTVQATSPGAAGPVSTAAP
jgi:hypothetical protein